METYATLTLAIGRLNQPVITRYQLSMLFFQLYRAGRIEIETLKKKRKTAYPSETDYHHVENGVLTLGVLQKSSCVPSSGIFAILGKEQASSEEIFCCIDPFSYISHMSAMEYHGLSDRISRVLFVSSPAPKQWAGFAKERMQKDFGGVDELQAYLDVGLPPLKRFNIRKINRKTINRLSSIHMGAFASIKGSALRVSTLGRTFADMIREPDLCGGIRHVLDIYDEHANRYLQLIVDEVDRHGTKIDKARAGYILEEVCNLNHPTIDSWTAYAQRGGSRKLVARNEYSSDYSDRWCLSVNIDG